MSLFRADLLKYYRIDCGSEHPPLRRRAKLWLTNLGLHCVAVYRLSRHSHAALDRGNWLYLPIVLLCEILVFLIRFFHHVDVFAANIGPGFYIGHVGTIYVGRCRIGANFSITHNVTLGVGSTGPVHGLPTVEDNVWIGSGSILYGSIRVGEGVTVNCGSVLSRSVPGHCLVGGNPARVILKSHDNAALLGGPLPESEPQHESQPEPPPRSLGPVPALIAYPSNTTLANA